MDPELNLTTETLEQAGYAEPLCVEHDLPVHEVLETLRSHQVGSILICREGKLAGIFTERDVLRLLASGADLDVPVRDVMVAEPVTVRHTDTVAQAIQTMSQGGYRRLPIVDDSGRPLGTIKVSGIVRYLVEHFPETVYNLPPDPNSVMHQREGA